MRRKLVLSIVMLAIAALFLSACQPAAMPANEMMYESAPSAPQMERSDADSFAYEGEGAIVEESPAMEPGGGAPSQEVKRVVIHNADLGIIVTDPGVTLVAITDMTQAMGGFVVSSNLYKTYTSTGVEVPEASVTIRVPAEHLNDALKQIKGMVNDPEGDIITENISGQDVTREYTDLQSRKRNLETASAQLEKIMENANKTEDVLRVYNELTRVNEEIEVIKGQIQYYDEASSMSAITVRLQAAASQQPIEIAGWKPSGTAREALKTLIKWAQAIADMLIWFTIFCLPFIVVAGVPSFFIVRGIVRHNKRRKAQAVAANE